MVPALLMFRRAARALCYAVREEEFVPGPQLGRGPAGAGQLVGIGILVEILRRLGVAFVNVERTKG